MQQFFELIKTYIVSIFIVLFIGLVLYGAIVIGFVVLTVGLVVGLIAWMIFYWKIRKGIRSFSHHDKKSGETLYYYEATIDEPKK